MLLGSKPKSCCPLNELLKLMANKSDCNKLELIVRGQLGRLKSLAGLLRCTALSYRRAVPGADVGRC